MISEKTIKSIEFDKILKSLSEYAVLDATKDEIISFSPLTRSVRISHSAGACCY